MNSVVMDASVILKWVFVEPYHQEAEIFLESEDLLCVAPDFALFECAGAIRRKIASGHISSVEGEEHFQTIRDLEDLELISTRSLTDRAFHLANLIGHDLYDCFYLAAAEQLGTVMVTADKKFLARVQNHGDYTGFVRWVEEGVNP